MEGSLFPILVTKFRFFFFFFRGRLRVDGLDCLIGSFSRRGILGFSKDYSRFVVQR